MCSVGFLFPSGGLRAGLFSSVSAACPRTFAHVRGLPARAALSLRAAGVAGVGNRGNFVESVGVGAPGVGNRVKRPDCVASMERLLWLLP